MLTNNPDLSEQVISLLSRALDMPPPEVVSRLEKPWGLLGAMRGDWPNYRLERQRTELENRLLAALEVIRFCEVFGQKDVNFVRKMLGEIILRKGGELPEA
jgi:hypothetical protein